MVFGPLANTRTAVRSTGIVMFAAVRTGGISSGMLNDWPPTGTAAATHDQHAVHRRVERAVERVPTCRQLRRRQCCRLARHHIRAEQRLVMRVLRGRGDRVPHRVVVDDADGLALVDHEALRRVAARGSVVADDDRRGSGGVGAVVRPRDAQPDIGHRTDRNDDGKRHAGETGNKHALHGTRRRPESFPQRTAKTPQNRVVCPGNDPGSLMGKPPTSKERQ